MRCSIHLCLTGLLALFLITTTGCNDPGDALVAQSETSHSHDDHDHDDHDHDGHDHDGHDHHDHGHDHHDHDHDGHDHHGHEHDGEDHSKDAHTDEHQHPETYDEAVKDLLAMHKTIAEAFDADNADEAHGPLHEVGHLLGDTEALVEKSDMDADMKKKLHQAIEQLFASYGAVDDKMHDADEGKDYSDVAEQIEQAISTLKAQAENSKD